MRKLFILFCFIPFLGNAQLKDPTFWKPAENPNKQRRNLVWFGGGGAAVLSLAALYNLWYVDYEQSPIHSTDDWNNWLQMDKLGHATVAYVVGQSGYDAFRWTGMPEKKAVWVGGSVGWAYLTFVEIMDGRSAEWGWSWGDFAFNTLGASMFIGQQLLWKDQRVLLKYSYHPTEYAAMNSDLLGENDLQRWMKDYNGQTYWLSANPRSFAKEGRMKWWPKWLNVAAGYGAEGMVTADGSIHPDYPLVERQRQYYFSIDIDLRRIKIKSGFLKTLVHTFSFIKIPAPTIQVNEKYGGTTFHWLYF